MSSTVARTAKRAAIHPRFRARRIAVKRDAGRRRLRRLVASAVVLAVIAVAYLVTRSPLLDLDHVQVDGATHTTADAVLAAGGLHRGQPMTDLDIDRAQHAITALPWVDSATVQRHWPGSVTVRITERRAVATLGTDDGAWLVLDATGRVLDRTSAKPTDLATIASVGEVAAPGQTVAAAQPALALAGYLTPDLKAWVTAIVTTPEGTLEADLATGIHVVFGTQAHLSDKAIGLATVLTRVDLKDLERIDLQVPNSPVLTRRGAAA